MDFFQAIILAVVEGITEFLPISSTGHLILTSKLLNIPQTEFLKSFLIIIQLGAVLTVVFLNINKIITFQKKGRQDVVFDQGSFGWANSNSNYYKINWNIIKNLTVAFIPTTIVGLFFYQLIKDILLADPLIVVVALLVGGLLLIGFEIWFKDKERSINSLENLTLKQSFLIGLAQSVSIIPGTSRSAASIIGGLAVGLKRKAAVEFSFLLAVPTMFSATSLDLVKTSFSYSANEWLMLAIGFAGSFLVALVVVKWFLKFIQTNNFIGFGAYRILLAILYWFFVIR